MRSSSSSSTLLSILSDAVRRSDFVLYTATEVTDVLFSSQPSTLASDVSPEAAAPEQSSAAPVLSSSSLISPHPSTSVRTGKSNRKSCICLNTGHGVAALPATHAILNQLNSALWLPVMSRLREREALTHRDCTGAIRYISAFTYRPLMPWLWNSSSPCFRNDGVASGKERSRGAVTEVEHGSAFTAEGLSQEGEVGREAEVYRNVSLAALEVARRPLSSPFLAALPLRPSGHSARVYVAADMATASPSLWAAIATAVVASAPAAYKERLRCWHDLLFSLRSNAVWVGTPQQLRDIAHPQLLLLFEGFYRDMLGRYGRELSPQQGEVGEPFTGTPVRLTGESSEGHSMTSSSSFSRAGLVREVEVRTLVPPILLRNLRSLYRAHRYSAMLFGELYAFCVQQEERMVHLHPPSLTPTAAPTAAPTEVNTQCLVTTELLMDVDLAAYYATLPGRRHSGVDCPAEQWTATLQHLHFLLPRLHRLQQCRRLQQGTSSAVSVAREVWQPWRQVISIVMNVCVWVANDNEEAARFCAALLCVVEFLQSAHSLPHAKAKATDSRVVHSVWLGALDEKEMSTFLTLTLEAARGSMRAKAEQLHYGPTKGLMGIYLLSVAISATVPGACSQTQPHRTQQIHEKFAHASENAQCNVAAATAAIGDTGDEPDSVWLRLHQLHCLLHASPRSPEDVWAAMRDHPHISEAARYGLVTLGYRLLADCVLPQWASPRTRPTAQRLWHLMEAWAAVVGLPLALDGKSVAALWRLRWQQQNSRSEVSDPFPIVAATEELVVREESQHQSRDYETTAPMVSPTTKWICGCGFENVGRGGDLVDRKSVGCVACVLRSLTAYTWTCPSCHAVAQDGVCVPYCLSCGDAHPLLRRTNEVDRADGTCGRSSGERGGNDEEMQCLTRCLEAPSHIGTVALLPQVVVGGACPTRVYCWDCGSPCSSSSSTPGSNRQRQEDDEAPSWGVEGVEEPPSAASTISDALVVVCAACGDVSEGTDGALCSRCCSCGGGGDEKTNRRYYTGAFRWMCGCGAPNSALHAYCHQCSRATRHPVVSCPHCRHVQQISKGTPGTVRGHGGSDAVCTRCRYPHPRRVAAVQQHRLVRCPACQGRVLATCRRCPHCRSTAVAAVAPFLPTEADQPWRCHHCGTAHAIRDPLNGRLRASPHFPEGTARPLAPVTLPVNSDDCRCARCDTPRLPLTVWERGRVWCCDACGEPHNTDLACRRCAVLAPGVVEREVHVWRCGSCAADHPSWEQKCRTVGCGAVRAETFEQFCYAPWTCAECGEVTLSSHMSVCPSCGAATPDAVRSKAPQHCETGLLSPAMASCAAAPVDQDLPAATMIKPAASHLASTPIGPPPPAAVPLLRPSLPSSRLAQVEEFLLRSAEAVAPTSGLTGPRDSTLVPVSASLWPFPSSTQSSAAEGSSQADLQHFETEEKAAGALEPWEDAFTTVVLSF